MSESNCIAITGKSHCSNWLYGLNDSLSNLIFVEPEDKVRISSLIDSVDVDVVLVHLPSQDRVSELSPAGASQSLNADLAVIEDLISINPALVIIALAETVNQDLVLPIIRAGARDIIRIGLPAYDTQAIINRHQRRPATADAQPSRKLGNVYTILNARSTDGNAFFSINTALEIQYRGATLLLDIGVPRGDVLLIMGLTSRFNLDDVIQNRARLDATLIETGFAKHSSGLSVLSMPDEAGRDFEITPADLHLVLYALKRHFEHIVINAAGITNPAMLKVLLSLTNSSFILMEQTIPSCKRNHDLIESLRQQKINIPNARIVIDRHLKNISPSADSIASSFGIPLYSVLPSVGSLRVTSMNTGESFFECGPNSTYVKAIKKLVQQLLGTHSTANDGRLQLLLSRLGNAFLRFNGSGKT